MPGTHCYVPQCINRGNSYVIYMIIFKPKTAAFHECYTRFAFTSSTQNSIIFSLPDTLAVRLLSSSFTFSFCKLQLSYLQIYFKTYA